MCASKIILSSIILAVLAYCNGEVAQFITEKPDDYDQKLENFQPPHEIRKRFLDDSSCYPQDYDRENNCKLKCKVQTPYKIKIGNQELVVPQKAADGFIQSFKSVECAEDSRVGHGPRNNCFQKILSSGITAECKTSYTTIEMWTLDKEGKMGKVSVPVPSGCHCEVSDLY